jgi:hypothetical protein
MCCGKVDNHIYTFILLSLVDCLIFISVISAEMYSQIVAQFSGQVIANFYNAILKWGLEPEVILSISKSRFSWFIFIGFTYAVSKAVICDDDRLTLLS